MTGTTPNQDDVPTVDLSSPTQPSEAGIEESTQQEKATEPSPEAATADQVSAAPEPGTGDDEDVRPDWFATGHNLFIDVDQHVRERVYLTTIASVGDEVGEVVMELGPEGLVELADQIEAILAEQEADDEDDDTLEDKSRWERIRHGATDPAGMRGNLERESPISGLSWKALGFLVFVGFTALAMVLAAVM